MTRRTISRVWIPALAVAVLARVALGDITADQKDAWLILYNVIGEDANSNGIADIAEIAGADRLEIVGLGTV